MAIGEEPHQEWLRSSSNSRNSDVFTCREIEADISTAIPARVKEVVLSNGFRYIMIVDEEGNEVYPGHMIHTVDNCPCGKEHGYSKIDLIDSPVVLDCGMSIDLIYQIERSQFCKSGVARELTTPQGTFISNMCAFVSKDDPNAVLSNELRVDQSRLWVKAYNDWDSDADKHYPTFMVEMSIQKGVNNFYIVFNTDGSFRYADLHLKPITNTWTEECFGDTITCTEYGPATKATAYSDEVTSDSLRIMMKEIFGITYGYTLDIDTKATADALIANMLTDEPISPKDCIVFKNVERIVAAEKSYGYAGLI